MKTMDVTGIISGKGSDKKDMEHGVKKPILKDEKEDNNFKGSKVKELLDRQVDHEFSNERLYIAMAVWAENHGYVQTAKFFSKHSFEEKRHGMDFVNFMAKKGMKTHAPRNAEIQYEFEDMEAMLKAALKREFETTAFIQELYTEAEKVGHPAVVIAHHYLNEQIEEEQLFGSLYNLYKVADGSKFDFESSVMELKTRKHYFKIGDLKTTN